MKFCPNCGSILEGKIKCDCGYDTLTGEVEEKTYKDFKTNQNDIVVGAKMMGINPNLSDEKILDQIHQPIFNKDNDNIFGEELAKIMENSYINDSTENNSSKKSED